MQKKGVQQYYGGGAENKKEEAGKGGARNGPVELDLGRFGS